MKDLHALLLSGALLVGCPTSFAQGGSTVDQQVVGVWRGHSVCGSKIVDGK